MRNIFVVFLLILLGAAHVNPAFSQNDPDSVYIRDLDGMIPVAVMSPEPEFLPLVAETHRKTIVTFFGREPYKKLRAGSREYTLDLKKKDYGLIDLTECEENAQQAVLEDHVVAILGPVTSGCTSTILSLGLDTPIISSLATATEFSPNHSKWFFRTIQNDRGRLHEALQSIKPRVEKAIVFYDASSVYAAGLVNDLDILANHRLTIAEKYSWDKFKAEDGVISFDQAFVDTLPRSHTVFVFGDSKTAVEIVKTLSTRSGKSFKFVIVGSTEFTNDAPENTVIIGEPKRKDSDNISTICAINGVVEPFISTLDASFALHQAIKKVLEKEGSHVDDLTVSAFRERIRTELSDYDDFKSCERGRKIDFQNNDGEVHNPPITPIHLVELALGRTVLTKQDAIPWVKIDVKNESFHHLEGPVIIDLEWAGHSEPANRNITFQVKDRLGDNIYTEKIELPKQEKARVFFDPSFKGSLFPHTLTITTNASYAEAVEVEFMWSRSYLLTALGALLGAALVIWNKKRKKGAKENQKQATPPQTHEAEAPQTHETATQQTGEAEMSQTNETPTPPWKKIGKKIKPYAEGLASGLLIALIVLHFGPVFKEHDVLRLIPIPRFSPDSWINAFVVGILGGWFGLTAFISFIRAMLLKASVALGMKIQG